MDLSTLHWGSPVGLGIFFVGVGIFFLCFFHGLAALKRAEDASRSQSKGYNPAPKT